MADINPTSGSDKGSITDSNYLLWGWDHTDVIGWDNTTKIGSLIVSNTGSIGQTPAGSSGSISPT